MSTAQEWWWVCSVKASSEATSVAVRNEHNHLLSPHSLVIVMEEDENQVGRSKYKDEAPDC